MESSVRVREHIKKDESGNVILTEIHRETLPPDIKGAIWWLERRFPEQFGRREQMEHTGKVKVQATQTQERKLTLELVKSDGTGAPAYARRCAGAEARAGARCGA